MQGFTPSLDTHALGGSSVTQRGVGGFKDTELLLEGKLEDAKAIRRDSIKERLGDAMVRDAEESPRCRSCADGMQEGRIRLREVDGREGVIAIARAWCVQRLLMQGPYKIFRLLIS